jgi:hypothetical protein
MDVVIHPMFKMENEKWAFAERLLFNKTAVVYISEENDRCGNVALIIKNKRYQIGGCPHLMGHIIIRISETEYKKICDKPLYCFDKQFDEEEEEEEEESDEEEEVKCIKCKKDTTYDECVHYTEDEYLCSTCGKGVENICIECYKRPCECEEEQVERKITGDCCLCDGRYTFYGNNAYPLAEGQCCNDCNERVVDARLGFKLSDVPATTGFMCIDKRNKNEFIFMNGKFVAHYNEDGYLTTAEFWSREKKQKIPEGAILVHKIDDDDGCAYIKLVEKDYVLVGDEAIVCDYDRDWFSVE